MYCRWILLLSCVGLIACDGSEPGDAGPGVDAGRVDSGSSDAGGVDSGGDVDAGGGVDSGGGDDAGPGDDAGMLRSIPEPGTFRDRWTADGLEIGPGHGTPETAFQVGTVSMSPFYIGATLDPVTGDAFWVFRTEVGVTSLDVALRGGGLDMVDFVHLHDGAGGVFGAEIPTDTFSMMPFEITASWTVVEDHVYVLEVHGSMGTFF